MNKTLLALAAALFATSFSVFAEDARPNRNSELSSGCTVCHGTDGVSRNPAIPSLQGMPSDILIKKFDEARILASGAMASISNGYNDDEIRSIATFFSKSHLENKTSK